jgi:hypothetical protein
MDASEHPISLHNKDPKTRPMWVDLLITILQALKHNNEIKARKI